MPFDGIVTKCIWLELKNTLILGRIEKIYQPFSDEIILNIRIQGKNLKLLLCANPSYPRIHFTENIKENPTTAPVFCMLLRKHLQGSKIIDVEFYDYERIISITVESLSELGDLENKRLIIEIMGKHSNIILVSNSNKIIDSIKHIDIDISSKREVMPARQYLLPPTQNKISPDNIDLDIFFNLENTITISVEKFLLNNIKGFSPFLCQYICKIAGIDNLKNINLINFDELNNLKKSLNSVLVKILSSDFEPNIVFDNIEKDRPVDFYCLNFSQNKLSNENMSCILNNYYSTKETIEILRQKKGDLVKIVQNNKDRCKKKLSIYDNKLLDVSDRDKLQLFGELLISNLYQLKNGLKSATVENYYSENLECLSIPLDSNKTIQENSQNYFKKYKKAKTTFSSTLELINEVKEELLYFETLNHQLESISNSLEIQEIRDELTGIGYIKTSKKSKLKKTTNISKSLTFISSDGIQIYVGKNNIQNDYLTLKFASKNDLWLHTKDMPGSHVIIKNSGTETPENTLYEAAMLAAYFSKGKFSSKVPVDYTLVKYVKKPSGAKPGMVIYTDNKTLFITPEKDIIQKLELNT